MSTFVAPRSAWMLRALLSARFHLAWSPSLTWITTLLRCAAGCACAISPLPARRKIAATAARALHKVFPNMKASVASPAPRGAGRCAGLCAFAVKPTSLEHRTLSRVRPRFEPGRFQRRGLRRREATRPHPALGDPVDRGGKWLFLGRRRYRQAS